MARVNRWYKRNPADALSGMMELNLEQKGAYNTVLDLIYVRDGDLRDEDAFIARACGCNVRRWRRLKAELVERGKLQIRDGNIHNERATVEIAQAFARHQTASAGGGASVKLGKSLGNVSAKDSPKIQQNNSHESIKSNGLDLTSQSQSQSQSQKESKNNRTASGNKKKIARLKLGEPDPPVKAIPVRWKTEKIPDDWKDWCRANCPTLNVDLTEECFVGHWLSVPGSKGLKTKWRRVWMNWCREDVRRAKRFEPPGQDFDFEKLRE